MAQQVQKKKIKKALDDQIFYAVIYIILAFTLLIVLYPCYFVVIASVSDPSVVNSGKMLLFPEGFNIIGYQRVFEDAQIWKGYANTILYTVGNTILGVSVTVLAGYALSKDELPFKNKIMGFMVFTMYFGGGLIPFYILMGNLKLRDTRFLMILLGCVSVYNVIIARTFFKSTIPQELEDAAYIDGCGTGKFFFNIVLPLSKAIIAVITLYVAVAKWNEYFNAMIFISDGNKFPLQVILRDKLQGVASVANSTTITDPAAIEMMTIMAETMKYAVIIVATLPVMCLYPFIQKYFAKGVMLGSVKG